MNRFKPALLVTLVTIGLVLPPEIETASAAGSQITYGKGKRVSSAPSFAGPMQCVASKIEELGYKTREIGCFGHRPKNRSAHPTGHACDVDQWGRDLTGLNKVLSRKKQIEVAKGCKAVSGCIWRSPDCGHFEQMSAPYSQAGARVGSHRYAGYEGRPTKKRRRT